MLRGPHVKEQFPALSIAVAASPKARIRTTVHIKPSFTLLLLIVVASLTGGCERPFVEADAPTLKVLGPDFSTVFESPTILLVVRADAVRSVESVNLDGAPLTFDADEQVWKHEVVLKKGLNRLVLSVTDSDGQTVMDTAYAYHAPLVITRDAPTLPDPRGGHSATTLQDGSILVIGGASHAEALADAGGSILVRRDTEFRPISGRMHTGRVGHTATLLPDGRVLIAGGSRTFFVSDIEDLIERVEVYDPDEDSFSTVPVVGEPIRRAFHTAVFRLDGNAAIIDLFGGDGDIQYSPTPLLGVRQDIRSFEFRNDSLFALSPAPGPRLGIPLAGHTQTPLEPLPYGQAGKMLIAGTYYGPQAVHNIAALIDYSRPGGLEPRETGRMSVERIHHAAALVRAGQVVVIGGHLDRPASAVNDVEVYVDEAGRFFRYPPKELVLRRFGLSATKLSNERILFLGGFAPSGDAVTFSEVYVVSG